MNLRPLPPQGSALPICATPRYPTHIIIARFFNFVNTFLKKIFDFSLQTEQIWLLRFTAYRKTPLFVCYGIGRMRELSTSFYHRSDGAVILGNLHHCWSLPDIICYVVISKMLAFYALPCPQPPVLHNCKTNVSKIYGIKEQCML